MTYLAFKVVHIFGVVLFLGNIIVTGVWKVLADRTGEPRTVAYAQRLVTVTDWVCTLGGVVLILVGAYGMVLTPRSAWTALAHRWTEPVHRLRHYLGGNPDSNANQANACRSCLCPQRQHPRKLLAS
jgi:uncharacterized membrane protein